MKKWLKKIIIGDDFYHVFNDISMLDHEVRKVRKEIVDLRNEILFELIENKSLLKQILEQRKIITDIKNNIEVVKIEEKKPVIKRELPDIPDKEVKIVKPILTQEAVKELFEYRDGDLYWKIDIYKGVGNSVLHIKAGTKLSSVYRSKNKPPFKQVKYQQKSYLVSRLIFLMFNGYLPEKVTFKDGDTLNTRIENLIEANTSEVHYRQKPQINSKTGIKGVYFDKRTNKYVAQIMKNGINIFIGKFNTQGEAKKARKEAEDNLYATFFNKCAIDENQNVK